MVWIPTAGSASLARFPLFYYYPILVPLIWRWDIYMGFITPLVISLSTVFFILLSKSETNIHLVDHCCDECLGDRIVQVGRDPDCLIHSLPLLAFRTLAPISIVVSFRMLWFFICFCLRDWCLTRKRHGDVLMVEEWWVRVDQWHQCLSLCSWYNQMVGSSYLSSGL